MEAHIRNRSNEDACPVFTGEARHRLHWNFPDPAAAGDGKRDVIAVFKRVRDDIKAKIEKFKVKSGKAPKSAPTYVKEEAKPGGGAMDKYKCIVCGYIYEPEKGDPDNKIAPGTPFEKLPDDWVCPVCGAAKDQFEKEA